MRQDVFLHLTRPMSNGCQGSNIRQNNFWTSINFTEIHKPYFILLMSTFKRHTSIELHKEHTGCLTPKGIQTCAVLTVLDIFFTKKLLNDAQSVYFKEKKVS